VLGLEACRHGDRKPSSCAACRRAHLDGTALWMEGALLQRAIDRSRWRSSGPVCTELAEAGGQGPASCNLAACPACAVLPETACEEFNSSTFIGLGNRNRQTSLSSPSTCPATEHQEGPWSPLTRRAQRRTLCCCPSSRTGGLRGEGRSRRADGPLARGRRARSGRCSLLVRRCCSGRGAHRQVLARVPPYRPPYLALIAGSGGELVTAPRQEALDARVHLVQRARRGTPAVPIGGASPRGTSRRG
jgi:hypothetical protein